MVLESWAALSHANEIHPRNFSLLGYSSFSDRQWSAMRGQLQSCCDGQRAVTDLMVQAWPFVHGFTMGLMEDVAV
jgi:hypothetical protein